MAKISTVDYEAIPGQASQMRSNGQQLNSELTTVYQSIGDMHSSWYGVRYNSLVTSFNEIVETLNELLQLVVTDIPVALENVANNYSQADAGSSVTSVDSTGPNKITELALTTDVGMRFITSEVQTVQSSVSQNFSNAVEQMNAIESVFNSITWESEAADAFKAQFTELKEDIVSSFEDLKEQFVTLMEQTQEDIQNAETANTVS